MGVQDIIKFRRLELGLTLKDVAKALNVSEGTVSRYESGEIQNMGIDKIEALSHVLRCSPGHLLGWEDSFENKSFELSNVEKRLFSYYMRLNIAGKKKLIERAEELLDLGYVEKGDAEKMA